MWDFRIKVWQLWRLRPPRTITLQFNTSVGDRQTKRESVCVVETSICVRWSAARETSSTSMSLRFISVCSLTSTNDLLASCSVYSYLATRRWVSANDDERFVIAVDTVSCRRSNSSTFCLMLQPYTHTYIQTDRQTRSALRQCCRRGVVYTVYRANRKTCVSLPLLHCDHYVKS